MKELRGENEETHLSIFALLLCLSLLGFFIEFAVKTYFFYNFQLLFENECHFFPVFRALYMEGKFHQ